MSKTFTEHEPAAAIVYLADLVKEIQVRNPEWKYVDGLQALNLIQWHGICGSLRAFLHNYKQVEITAMGANGEIAFSVGINGEHKITLLIEGADEVDDTVTYRWR